MARALKGHPKGPYSTVRRQAAWDALSGRVISLRKPTEGGALGYDGIAFQAGLVGDILVRTKPR